MSDLIPDGWSFSSLADISNFRRGSFPQPYGNPEWYDDNGFPFVQVFDLGKSNLLKPSTKVRISKLAAEKSVFVPKGTVLVSIQGSIGRVVVTQYDAYVDRTILIFNDIVPHVDRDFFALMVREIFAIKKNEADGGVIKTITKETLKDFLMVVPPLPEQQKIAAIITSVDNGIEKTQAQIDKLKDLKTGMMQELLTRGVGVDGKPHTEFKDSPVGRIPKGWDVKNVSELQDPEKYSCVGGPFGSDLTSKDYVENAGVPVIRGGNLHLSFEKFHDDDFVFVSEEKADSLVRNMAYPGELIFTQRGTMGQVGLIPKVSKFSRYVVSQSQMKLKINESLARREYLYQYFLSDAFKRQLDLDTIATGLPHINLGILKSFSIPLPSLEEQNKIEKLLLSIDHRCLLQIHKKQKFISLKKSLMQDLLTGKIRVKVNS